MDLLTGLFEEPKLARIRTRIFAALIDFVILFIIFYVIALLSGQTYSNQGGVGFHLTGFPAFIAMLLGFILIPVNEGITGQTIGKRFFKIKVVKSDFTKTTLGVSIVRHLFDGIDCFFLAGLIVAANNKHKQRVGDLVAKTYVVVKE
jgi:uncharacterized RDD family membrane protein YckC